MISRIRGNLSAVDEKAAYVESGGLVYQVLVPLNIIGDLTKRLDGGAAEIDLYTVHYIEGGIGSGNMVPRLIGFLNEEDREFFRVFTTVRGLGVRKALRALSIPISQLVRAIETGDRPVLKRLPEIGSRTAERIIAELKGKLAAFAVETEPEPAPAADPQLIEQAKEILMLRLQFSRTEADAMVRNVMAANRDIKTIQDLLREVFKLRRQGAPGK